MRIRAEITADMILLKTINDFANHNGLGSLRKTMAQAGIALIGFQRFSNISRVAFAAASLLLFSLASSARAQTSCPGSVAQMVSPDPGTTLPGNDVTFTWCNANADYFLQIESIPGARNIFYGLVPAQNLVHLINLPTNGATIYVTLWTQLKGTWQAPFSYAYTAANLVPPGLKTATLGADGRFQFTISGVTPGKTNVVQASVNLVDWSSISTNVAASNSLQFVDDIAMNFTQRYYRSFEIR